MQILYQLKNRFELACDKYFYYDHAQRDKVNYFSLGNS